jgi:hypothetical protein
MPGGLLVWAAVPAAAFSQARPQPRLTLDVGAMNVEWTPITGTASTVVSPRQTGFTVTPGVHVDRARGSFDAGGTLSTDPAGGAIVQLVSQGSLFSGRVGLMRGEVHGMGTWSRLADAFTSHRAQGGARVHASGGRVGAWAGAQAGRAGAPGYDATLQAGDVGAWLATGRLSLVTSVSPSLVTGPGDSGTVRDAFTDVDAGARYAAGPWDVGVALGSRMSASEGVQGLGGRRQWVTLAATYWVAPSMAVVAAGGTYPADVLQRFPGGRFASVAIRFAAARPRNTEAPQLAATGAVNITAERDEGAPAVRLARVAGTSSEFYVSVSAANAKQIELAGDFSNWVPVSLPRRESGLFVVRVTLPVGTSQVAVRVDGGPWRAPAGLPVIRDEFGGEAGLLTRSAYH